MPTQFYKDIFNYIDSIFAEVFSSAFQVSRARFTTLLIVLMFVSNRKTRFYFQYLYYTYVLMLVICNFYLFAAIIYLIDPLKCANV